jgi:hypothetical protein
MVDLVPLVLVMKVQAGRLTRRKRAVPNFFMRERVLIGRPLLLKLLERCLVGDSPLEWKR